MKYGDWRYSFTILDLGSRWRCVIIFMLLPLYPRGNSLLYPLDRRLGVSQSRSGCNNNNNNNNNVRFEVVTAGTVKGIVFWDVTP
jgi:hypothetical protein